MMALSRKPTIVLLFILASRAVASSEESTGVEPLPTECRGPRTECAGLVGTTWPVTSQSNNMRIEARCCLTLGAAIWLPSYST